MKTRTNIKLLVQLALLTAAEAVLAFTPLGSIPIGPIVATLAHIPVLVAAIYLGYGAGIYMGTVFGLFSFIVNSFVAPTVTSFVFTPFMSVGEVEGNFFSLVICFVPRILLAVAATFVFKSLSKVIKNTQVNAGIATVVGSLLHTFLVLGGIYLFFGGQYSEVVGVPYEILLATIMGVVLTNGVPEAIIAALINIALVVPMRSVLKQHR